MNANVAELFLQEKQCMPKLRLQNKTIREELALPRIIVEIMSAPKLSKMWRLAVGEKIVYIYRKYKIIGLKIRSLRDVS